MRADQGPADRDVAPSHGPVLRKTWRDAWAFYQDRAALPLEKRKNEKQVAIIYVSAYGNTTMMAKKVARAWRGRAEAEAGQRRGGLDPPDPRRPRRVDRVLVGAPTLNSNLPEPIYSMLGYLVVLNVKGLTSSAFGSFGWSGEATKIVTDIMAAMRIKVYPEPIKFKMTPTEADTRPASVRESTRRPWKGRRRNALTRACFSPAVPSLWRERSASPDLLLLWSASPRTFALHRSQIPW